MSTVADGGATSAGLEALHQLKSTEPPLYLTPSSVLSKAARLGSVYLFSSISPHAPKSPLPHLLTNGFDPEQIWQQIDLQGQPLLSSLRRQVRNFEKNPELIEKQFNFDRPGKEEKMPKDGGNEGKNIVESESEELDDEEDEDEEDEEMENEESEHTNGLDDKFFKVNELDKLLADAEAKEYDEEGEEEEEEDDEDDEDEDVELEDADDHKDGWGPRYDDYFVKEKSVKKREPKHLNESDDDVDNDESHDDDEDDDDDDASKNKQSLSSHEKELSKFRSQVKETEKANVEPNMQKESLSTHEKELARLHSEAELMEKANMEPKTWTMQGEVTADKRPKNSALEVDLDFDHNVRPAPVITEEVTASLEEIISKRILEGRFDDNRKPPALMDKAPRERKELDENKSKQGLGDVYEAEYVKKTGLVSVALTFSDEQKKEASTLFKKLCLKLDALSHFHFTPKPVIEDMSIQANVPALAMEEIAPLAVSDAGMLAPEEVFSGKGDIKEETELTQAERKRRRANKKRKFKAESDKKAAMKVPQQTVLTNHGDGNEDPKVV